MDAWRAMRLPNVNKLFPRLTIRTKLAIAFTAIATLPLLAVATLTVRTTLARLHELAERAVEHDLQSAREDVSQALAYAQRDVEYVSDDVAAAVFRTPADTLALRAAAQFLLRSRTVFRVRAVAADGTVLVSLVRGDPAPRPTPGEDALYYALQADSLRATERVLLPVEVAPTAGRPDALPVPAVAIVLPVRSPSGTLLGAVVGEAFAADLFAGLVLSDPLVPGVTMLVDRNGLVLYHSERKPGWDRLVARGREIHEQDLQRSSALLGRANRLVRGGDRFFGATTLRLGNAASAPRLTLYRAVPAATVNAPVLEFLTWAVITGGLILVAVLGIAVLAARQFTKPIYALSGAAQALARGAAMSPLRLETNDEIEDLGRDFNQMAHLLAAHRRDLEATVAERTEALRRTHAELADVVSHAADAIVLADMDQRVILWNGGAESLFGWEAAETVGRRVADLLLPSDGTLAAEAEFIAREVARHGAIVNLQTRRQARDGRLVPVSLTQSTICDEAGTPYGESLILRDATLQARLEAQMRRSERLAAVSVMAAGLAHELNNPLAILANRIEIMQAELAEGADASRLRQDLTVLRGHISRLSGVTRNLLRFGRNEDDPPRSTDLGEIVDRSTELLERTLVSRNVRVVRAVASGLPPVVAPVQALETVLLNLLLNAADAMPAGGRITIGVGRAATDDWVDLTVADEGGGIPYELQDRIFEPFFTTKEPGRGTGLGLAVCRSIVESHGGRLRVESEPGGGACFHVILPAAAAESA